MTVDLSKLTPPDFVAAVSTADIVADIKADLSAALPEMSDRLDDPSELLVKILEAFASYVVKIKAQINDDAKGCMLAYAWGDTLDHLGAFFGVSRLEISAGSLDASPPVAAVLESDDALRARVQAALEGFTTCGSIGAYEFHARSADGRIEDVQVSAPEPGLVRIVFSAFEASGEATAAPLAAVIAAVNDETRRPLTDSVEVLNATVVPFDVVAELKVGPGPDPALVVAEAQERIIAAAAKLRRVGQNVPISAIYAALHGPSVSAVLLSTPDGEINVSDTEVAVLRDITLTTNEVA